MQAQILAKVAGNLTKVDADNTISVSNPSVVHLKIAPEAVSTFERHGNDLKLVLMNGEEVLIQDFFVQDEQGNRSDLVLEDEAGVSWWGQYASPWQSFHFAEIESDLFGVVPWWWAVLGLAGIGAAAAAIGGGGGGGGDEPAPAPVPPKPPVVTLDPIAQIVDPQPGDTVTLTGTITVPPGSGQGKVKVNVGGTDYDAVVNPDGTWSVDVPADGLTDGTPVRVVGTAEDGSGTESEPSKPAEGAIPVQHTPEASTPPVATEEDQPVTGKVTGADKDGDPLKYTVEDTDKPGHGQVTIDPDTGEYTYTPDPDFHGEDRFTVTVDDGRGGKTTVEVVVTVNPVNDAPQVYDRVIPAQSDPTLYVLFSGVLLAIALGWVMRNARVYIIDVLGKRADLRISDRVFGHALRLRNTVRPKATGTFVSQVREVEPVRDMLTSTTVAAIADLPFFLLFCVIFWYIAGSLVWVPLAAFVLLVLPSLLVQKRLRALAQESMRESSLRSAMLVEAVQGIEDIKLLQAEPSFQNRWNHYNAVEAESGLKLRHLMHHLNNWSQTVQGAAFAVVVFFGAPMVMTGEMSTGVLVAASILSTRMLAPLAGVTQVLNRWQQARVAAEGLDQLMHLPVDHAPDGTRVQRPVIQGEYELRQALYTYDGQTPALRIKQLTITPGERIGVLGRNGSGKSTLLQALSGLLEAQMGTVTLDGVALGHIDPADVRRDVSLLTQQARLFHGSLRENLRLGARHATDAEIVAALQAAGAWTFVQRLPMGLDYPVTEGGLGLSGGQRQSLLLARLLLRHPTVLLLDEPTAMLDESAERAVIRQLRELAPGRTLVVATHRPAVLEAVDRVIVLEAGAIVLDGPRDEILTALRRQRKTGAAS